MQTSDVRAYEGKEPFIFISYAHKDSARVLPILAQLQSRGYRVWYDEGIAPGSEWPENIAQHLNDCAVTVAFVSNNSMASPNCRREITYALSKKKPFLGIFLEQAEMSPGMELQMSAQQCVMKYSYRSEDMFYDKVCSCPDLAPCKKAEPTPVTMPPVAPVPKAVAPVKENILKQKPWLLAVAGGALVTIVLAIVLLAGSSDSTGPSGTENKNLGVHTSGSTAGTTQTPSTTTRPVETEPSQPTQPEQTVPTSPVESTEPTDPSDPTEPEDDDNSTTVTLYPDKVVDKDTDYLYLYDKTITADTIHKINKLESLEMLELKECTFDPSVLDSLDGAERIRYLHLTNCSGITDYTFLNNYSQLQELSLNNCGVTDSNFPQLTILEMDTLDLSNNSEFTDLSKLSQLTQLYKLSIAGTGVTSLNGFPIEAMYVIDFSYTAIRDISRLADCGGLSKVYGIQTSVTSIASLAKLENLSVLAFSNSPLNEITTPFYSLYLRELYLSNCGLNDVSGLTHLTQLEVVDLSKNSLSDVSFVQESYDTLRELNISNLPLASGTNFSFLSKCEHLEVLYVNNVALQNLNFCSTLTSLVGLHASNCSLNDISGLENCTGLQYIHLPNNQISDVSSLAYLGEDYITLDLAYNQLTDVSTLSKVAYKTLCLVGNSQLDLSTVTVNGNTLLISYAPDLETKLADNFYYYKILSCPLNKVIALREVYGEYSVTFLENEEEFFTTAAEYGLYYAEN